jgi:cytochrome c551/c552
LNIKGVQVSADGIKVRLLIDNMRQYYLHQINLNGMLSADGVAVLHPVAYYTLNNIPAGEKLPMSEVSTMRTKKKKINEVPVKNSPAKTAYIAALSYDQIKPLLDKNTCTACHQTTKRQVGPAFAEIAKRKYSNEKIVDLIYNPQPKNWPDYATEMAPLPQVPKDEALKIAAWINTLRAGD